MQSSEITEVLNQPISQELLNRDLTRVAFIATNCGESMLGDRLMNADLTSGDHFAEVNAGDPLYRDLQLRGYNRRFVGTPDSVFVVDDTDQVVNAVDAAVASRERNSRCAVAATVWRGWSTIPRSSA